jgi:hypothetical protein
VLSPRFRYTILYCAGLSDQGSDSSSSPTLLVVGTSEDHRYEMVDARVWRQVKDEARESPVRFLE